MPFHCINECIQIPEIDVKNIKFDGHQSTVYLQVDPIDSVQDCPYCGSAFVKRNGVPYHRHIRHLSLAAWRTVLVVPSINMHCKRCAGYFVWDYDFVAPKKQYTKAFGQQLIQHGHGTTVQALAGNQAVPYSTAERYYKNGLCVERTQTQATCIQDAIERNTLVLGIDDFAIRKGHTYNTGLHDLKGGTMLDIISGRKQTDLQDFQQTSAYIHALNPVAVIMDLSYTDHRFVKDTFPQAIRVADRFHVNRYVTEAMHDVRKEVQKTLAPHARKQLKCHHRLLEKRYDMLTAKEQKRVLALLTYDDQLNAAYQWKETFIDWYDLSNDAAQAKRALHRWYQSGRRIQHAAVESAIQTIQNWETEVINYHRCRFTNAPVEGRHNKIKGIQRRHYFTPNRKVYENRILVECNWAYMQGMA